MEDHLGGSRIISESSRFRDLDNIVGVRIIGVIGGESRQPAPDIIFPSDQASWQTDLIPCFFDQTLVFFGGPRINTGSFVERVYVTTPQ